MDLSVRLIVCMTVITKYNVNSSYKNSFKKNESQDLLIIKSECWALKVSSLLLQSQIFPI